MLISKLDGKIINEVYLDESGESFDTLYKVEENKLLNLDIDIISHIGYNWLILAPYGNYYLTPKLTTRLLNCKRGHFTLAIDKNTGVIYLANFVKSESNEYFVSITLSKFFRLSNVVEPLSLPKPYLSRLDELKNSKRPFCLYLNKVAAISFIDKEIGYSELEKEVEIEFDFKDKTLLVSLLGYKEISKGYILE
jgi:uncharacterized protein involved in high-affinity Fe2+ transport